MSAHWDLVNLGVCIKNQADRLDIEHEGVPLEGVVVRLAEAAIAARGEATRLFIELQHANRTDGSDDA